MVRDGTSLPAATGSYIGYIKQPTVDIPNLRPVGPGFSLNIRTDHDVCNALYPLISGGNTH